MFRYIYEDDREITCFDRYFEYIERNKDILPGGLYAFASDRGRYAIDSERSLHDAWLSSIEVKENTNPDDKDFAQTNIEIKLLGSMHDWVFFLSYINVSEYLISKKKCIKFTRQNDLINHEFRINNKELEHEIHFDNSFEILISCEDFQFKEDLL